MEYPLNIDQSPVFDVEQRGVNSQEFLHQHRDIKAVTVKSGEITPFQKLGQRTGQLLKSRLIGYVFIINPVNKAGFQRYGNGRVNFLGPGFNGSVKVSLGNGDLNYPVPGNIDACSFEINKSQGLF